MSAVLGPAGNAVDLNSPEAAAAGCARSGCARPGETGEQLTLLGVARSTLYQWKQGRFGALDRHVLERLSYLFGIYAALQILPAGAGARQRMAAQAQLGAPVRRAPGARADAGRSGFRPLCGAPVPGCAARGQGLIDVASVPVERRRWLPCYRLIASRYPTVG